MSQKTKKSEILSIVIVGSFNPQIFHPAWFLKEELVSESASEAIDVRINSKTATILQNDWFTMEVSNQKFKIQSNQSAYYEIVRDLVAGIFQILSSTPITALGINNSVNVQFEKKADKAVAGKQFVNGDVWSKILAEPVFDQITIRSSETSRKFAGYQKVTIQPSVEIEGVFVDVNYHFSIAEDPKFEAVWGVAEHEQKFTPAEHVCSMLLNEFKEVQKENMVVLSKVLEYL